MDVSDCKISETTKDMDIEFQQRMFGDLPKNIQPIRLKQEHAFTVNKTKQTTQTYNDPLPEPKNGFAFVVLGTNGTECFALECISATAEQFAVHLGVLETTSMKQHVSQLIKANQTESLADDFEKLAIIDPKLHKGIGAEDMLKKIRQPKKNDAVISNKPFAVPKVTGIMHAFETTLTETKEVLEPCYVWIRDKKWKNCAELKIRTKTMPVLSFNSTHVAIIYQGAPTAVICELYQLPRLRKRDTFHILFPAQHFAYCGIMNAHLSEAGIVSITLGSSIMVFDTTRKIDPHPRIICVAGAPTRLVTFAAHQTDTTMLVATSVGECFGLSDWRDASIAFCAATPLREPAFSATLSNNRLIIQTVDALCGTFQGQSNTYLSTGRMLGFSVCGTLIFVLSKYGGVYAYSTAMRNVVFTYDDLQPISVGAYQHAYPCVHAKAERVAIVYPSGVFRTIEITEKALREIDESRLNELKNKKK